MGIEGRIMRLASDSGVKREEIPVRATGASWTRAGGRYFRAQDYEKGRQGPQGYACGGQELDEFVERHEGELERLRAEIIAICDEAGLALDDFKRIVATVQKGERESNREKRKWSKQICVW